LENTEPSSSNLPQYFVLGIVNRVGSDSSEE
jgi:hypothetical protein